MSNLLNPNILVSIQYSDVVEEISGLDVDINCKITKQSTSNECTLVVHNPSESMIDRLINFKKEKQSISVFAGYESQHLMFKGNISDSQIGGTHPENNITIKLKDGGLIVESSAVSLSYKKGASIKNIIKNVANSMSKNTSIDTDNLGTTISSMSLTGRSAVVMDELTRSLNLDWSIQRDIVTVSDPRVLLGQEVVTIVGFDSGLLENAIKKDNTIKFRSLFNNDLSIGSKVNVVDDIGYDCVIIKSEITGNNYGQGLTMMVEGAIK